MLLFCKAFACTIGIVTASASNDGKARIFKSRDIPSLNVAHRRTNYPINYIGVGNTTSIFMGVNEKGFAIVNSLSEDLRPRTWDNSYTLEYALGHCQTLQQFEALLDSTNITERNTITNYAVMDMFGRVAIYEVAQTSYQKFVTDDYLVRTNYSETGGGTNGVNRRVRAERILADLMLEDKLDTKHIMQKLQRDLVNEDNRPYRFPFNRYYYSSNYQLNKPFAFIHTEESIARQTNGSACVIEQALRLSNPHYTTMFTALGYPVTSVAVPLMPFVDLPDITTQSNPLIYNKVTELKQLVVDGVDNFLNSYLLINDNNTGLWSKSFALEDSIITNHHRNQITWRNITPTNAEIKSYQDSTALKVYNFLNTFELDNEIIPDFLEHYDTGVLSKLSSTSFNNPTSFRWDFNNDGIYDAFENFAEYEFEEDGEYLVKLRIDGRGGPKTITKIVYAITSANPNEYNISKTQLYPNPFNPSTNLSFSLKQKSNIKLKIYNIKGQLVWQKQIKGMQSGNHSIPINLKNQSSGLYFCTLSVKNQTITKKMLLVK